MHGDFYLDKYQYAHPSEYNVSALNSDCTFDYSESDSEPQLNVYSITGHYVNNGTMEVDDDYYIYIRLKMNTEFGVNGNHQIQFT